MTDPEDESFPMVESPCEEEPEPVEIFPLVVEPDKEYPADSIEPQPSTVISTEAEPEKSSEAIQANCSIQEVDPDILIALGEITNDSPDYGEKIHDCLAKIWTPLLKKGLSKDVRKKLIKDYLIPENCPLLKAPTLNPEILAALPETGRFRDKKILASQQQLGVGITAINRGLNILLSETSNKVDAIKFISDGCRVLSDLHFQNTESRIKFISPGLDKSFLQLIQASERDDLLFGSKLSEKIKASKAIAKQSQHIKKAPNAPKAPPLQTQILSTRPNNQRNWQGPPRYSSNRGGGGGGGLRRTSQRPPVQSGGPQLKPLPSKTRGVPRRV
ncbi:uncharacterized protein LOC131843591 [Achroia grisella]|uniref:uncharacterized protein LOC131843591 n=1 Tax=Achroia grisella TaxID=688607 RepID=UPI0027D22C00|nr:uncharacterized protein LOC131843591 [Achroia grisella]